MNRHSDSPTPGAPDGLGAPEFIVAALDRRWRRFLVELRRNRRRKTERGIHDLRVAIRRLIAVLDLASLMVPGAVRPRLLKSLASALRSFSPLRDLHVQILGLSSLRRQFSAATSLVAVLRVRERLLVKDAGRRIARVDTVALGQEIAGVQAEIIAASGDDASAAAMKTVLLGYAARRFLRVHERHRRLSAANLRSIHRMRVAFKRYRYTVEVLQPILPGVTKQVLEDMNAFQDLMGAIQDIEVLAEVTNAGRAASGPVRGTSAMLLRQHLALKRRELVDVFLPQANTFLDFWPGIGERGSEVDMKLQAHGSFRTPARDRR
jgi:CHAD domain-containing protein